MPCRHVGEIRVFGGRGALGWRVFIGGVFAPRLSRGKHFRREPEQELDLLLAILPVYFVGLQLHLLCVCVCACVCEWRALVREHGGVEGPCTHTHKLATTPARTSHSKDCTRARLQTTAFVVHQRWSSPMPMRMNAMYTRIAARVAVVSTVAMSITLLSAKVSPSANALQVVPADLGSNAQ